jgi:hypothetical protein
MATDPMQTPAYWERHSKDDLLEFDINIYLPVRHGRLRVNAFETDLPLFRHDVGFLEDTVEFQQLSLKGANQPINVKVSVRGLSKVMYSG